MADAFSVEITQDQITGALSRAAAALESPHDLLESIGGLLEARVNQRFNSKTDPDGVAWLPLSRRTLARYKRIYRDKKTGDVKIPGSLLQRTNHMLNSLTHNTGSNYVEVGFSDEKAAYHETGTRGGVPRRAMLFGDFVAGTLGAGDTQAVLDEVDTFLQALL